MKPFIFLLLFALPFFSFAQDFAENSHLAGNPTPAPTPLSSWRQEEDLVNGSISKLKLSKMKSVTTTLEHAELTITANDLQPLLGHLAVGHQQFLTMDISPAEKNGGQYFEYAGMDGNVTVKRWLITSGIGQLPYVAVTRKEYLQAAKIELAAIRIAIIATVKEKMPVRPAAIQEAEKKAMIDQLTNMYTGLALEVRMRQYLRNYRTDEQYLKDNTDKEMAGVDSTMHLMDNLLAHLSATELGKPAIVSVPAVDFNGFEDGHTDKMLVRINPTYFNGGLSDEKPQLFLVEWRYDASNAAAADIDQQLMQNFDGHQLKALLGK
jgi:hypothetical protein